MTDHALDRLRRTNPFPGELAPPPLDRIRGRLDGENRPERNRRRLRLEAIPVLVAVAVSVAVVVFAVADLRTETSRPASHAARAPLAALRGVPLLPPRTPATRAAYAALAHAREYVIEHDRCGLRRPPLSPPDHGTPARYLLSAFGVLDRGRTVEPDASMVGSGSGVFVRYVELARRQHGFSIYAYARSRKLNLWFSPRCERLLAPRLKRDLRRTSPGLRRSATRLDREEVAASAYAARHPEAVCVFEDGGGSCGDFYSAVTDGLGLESGLPGGGSLTTVLVPDGVYAVRLEVHGRSFTARVLDNVVSWRLPHVPLSAPSRFVWLGAHGRVLRGVPTG